MSEEFQYESFVKAVKAYFDDRKVEIAEFRALTAQDKVDLSTMLNDAGCTHPPYTPPLAEAA